jgi:hypothetical protein
VLFHRFAFCALAFAATLAPFVALVPAAFGQASEPGSQESLASKEPPETNPQKTLPETPEGPTALAKSIVLFGTFGPGSGDHSKSWNAWEEAYFPKKSSRGVPWGGGVRARIAFTPQRLFSAELDLGLDTLRVLNEDSDNDTKVKAHYATTFGRAGVNCLFPRLLFVRPSIGLLGGLGLLQTKFEIADETTTESEIVLDLTAHLAARFETLGNVTVEPGLLVNLYEGVLYTVGVGYAF